MVVKGDVSLFVTFEPIYGRGNPQRRDKKIMKKDNNNHE